MGPGHHYSPSYRCHARRSTKDTDVHCLFFNFLVYIEHRPHLKNSSAAFLLRIALRQGATRRQYAYTATRSNAVRRAIRTEPLGIWPNGAGAVSLPPRRTFFKYAFVVAPCSRPVLPISRLEIFLRWVLRWCLWCNGSTRVCGALGSGSIPDRHPRKE